MSMLKRKVVADVKTVVCVATGISLTLEDAEYVRNCGLPVIAISDNYKLFPNAIMNYACDYRWWKHHFRDVLASGFTGVLASADPSAANDFGVKHIASLDWHVPQPGLSGVADAITCGYSTGYQAIHIAYNLGFKRIILLGYDYGATGQGHWYGSHPPDFAQMSDFTTMIKAMEVLARDIGKQDVEVINCTPTTDLACFKRMALREVI